MLAIIIPYYKLSFFEEALQSLVNQTDKRFKVYIGDDASPENPAQIVEKYKVQLDLVYHRFETNLGGNSLVKQWERCIALSNKEEWLMILGDDDVLSSNTLEQFYHSLEDIIIENCNIVRFSTLIIDEKNMVTSTIYTHPKVEKATDFFYRRFTNKTRSSLSEYVFKRNAYVRFGFYHYDLAWFADDRAWLEFSEYKNIYTINSAIVYFRSSHENISRNDYKIKEKRAVQLQFFKFIVSNVLMKFKPDQQKHFMMYYEQLIYKNKKVSFSFWFFLSWSFIKCIYFVEALKFTRRVLIYLKNNAK
jgi:glycosyltransferase involved in cell wall biosynthesis